MRCNVQSAWKEAKDIIDKIRLPEIPEKEYHVKIPSGEDIRPELQAMLDICSNSGGGRVIVPQGVYRCNGPLNLRSSTELHFEDGAVIKFSPHPEHYLPQVFTRWEGVEIYNFSPMIYGKNLTDVAVTGKATLIGGNEIFASWLPLQNEAQERSRCFAEQGVPVEQRVFSEKDHLRASMFQLVSCERILIDGITLTNAPFWMFHPLYCRDVTFRNVACDSMFLNNDGIDIDSCENVLVEDSVFRNGDDAIVVKSGRDHDGWRVNHPTRNVVIRNCHIYEAMHGVAIGSELSGGAENIWICNIRMDKIYRQAIQFKSNRDRGGVIHNVKVHDISVAHVDGNLIYFFSDYPGFRNGNSPSIFRDFHLEKIRCGYAANVFHLQGTPEFPLKNIVINDVSVENCDVVYASQEYAGNTVLSGIVIPES